MFYACKAHPIHMKLYRTGWCGMANKVEICGVNTAKLPVYKDYEMQEMLPYDQSGGYGSQGQIYYGKSEAGFEV